MDEKQKTLIKLYKVYLESKYDGQSFPVDSQKFERLDLSLDNDKDRVIARNEAINQYRAERSNLGPMSEKLRIELNKQENQNDDFIDAFDKAMISTKEPAAHTKTFEKYTDELRSFTIRNKIELDEIDKLYKGPTITFHDNKPPVDKELTALSIYKKDDAIFIGREQYSDQEKEWKPYNVLSGPYKDLEHAEKDYNKIKEFRGIMDGIGTENLKTIARSYNDPMNDDPKKDIKAGIIKDYIKHDREEPKKEISIVETKTIEFHTFR